MENASKALLIAAAILLAILLISLGIMVYNNAKGTISDTNLDQETAQAFNTKISQYCGANKTATTMNSLMDAIAASNGAQNGKAVQHPIKVTYNSVSYGYEKTSINAAMTRVGTENGYPTFDNSNRYTATYVTDADGYIKEVTIN